MFPFFSFTVYFLYILVHKNICILGYRRRGVCKLVCLEKHWVWHMDNLCLTITNTIAYTERINAWKNHLNLLLRGVCNVVENRQLNKHKNTGTDFSKELGKLLLAICWVKGTGSRDRIQIFWQKYILLGLIKFKR